MSSFWDFPSDEEITLCRQNVWGIDYSVVKERSNPTDTGDRELITTGLKESFTLSS